MDLTFDFDQRQGITGAHFDGLDGAEPVYNGVYRDVPDAEYQRMIGTVKYISSLWRYADEPGDSAPRGEMNALTLLANALEELSQLNAHYQPNYSHGPPCARPRAPPHPERHPCVQLLHRLRPGL